MTTTASKLGDLMARRQPSVTPSQFPNEVFHLFSIPAYDSREPDTVFGADVGSAKKTIEPGDVLLSRIVPHIRRAWVVPEGNGIRQIASSEWIVFRHDDFHPQYLQHFLKSDVFHVQFMNTVAGVGGSLLRARPDQVAKINIDLPKLEQQKRVADILEKADSVRDKRNQARDTANHLVDVAFHHFFGDCISNKKSFASCDFEDLCGKIIDCPHSTPAYADSETNFACVRSSDLQDGYIDWGSTKYVTKSEYETRIARHTPVAGEVVYTREGGRLGNAAQIPEGATVCLGQRIMLFSSKDGETTNEFLWALLKSPGVRHQVNSLTAGAAAPRVNIKDLRKLKAFLPPYELQQKFTLSVKKIEELRQKQIDAESEAKDLFHSLVQRAFKGEL